ncbi:MAG: autotransporter domain-containing protein [Bacteroidota bacterium]|jgi:outer membrane protein|nr:autotransporter outer membrane beta-barrel domain-containing protein [Cytophagales bacterium]MCE2958970.1 autotransporter outer membrane beta-barrel domain-containing protein [Flammeovirgaceae bacterium]MCZ8069898.1 autotransporter domain-containing protein [Cytophagales bacterium]
MKKIIFFAFVLISTASFAQFSKGSILLGGSVSADFTTNKTIAGSTTTTNSSTNSFSISPNVGYFVIDNLAVGGALQFNTTSTKDDGSRASFSSNSFALQPFGRYYFDKFYAQASFGFGSYKSENTNGNGITTTNKGSLFNWALAGGYVFLLNDHVGLEPQIGYGSQSQSPDGSNVTVRDAGLFLRLGIQVYLTK